MNHINSNFRTLVLKDFGNVFLLPLLKNIYVVGTRLKRLDLHYLDSSPGVSIEDVDTVCPYLEYLTICDSLLTWTHEQYNIKSYHGKKPCLSPRFCQRHQNRPCHEKDHFRNLKMCKLYRVSYKQPEDWEIFFRFAPNLKSLHLESSRNMTDSSFQSILSDQDLTKLEVLIALFLFIIYFFRIPYYKGTNKSYYYFYGHLYLYDSRSCLLAGLEIGCPPRQ